MGPGILLTVLLKEPQGAKNMSADFSFILRNTRSSINEQLLPKTVVEVTNSDGYGLNINKSE